MRGFRHCTILLLLPIFLMLASVPAGAAVSFQCPGFDPANFEDTDGDGMLRGDEINKIADPAIPDDQVCMHLAAGDGFVRMADGRDQYMFSFVNVTHVPDDQVMNMWDVGDPGGGMMAATFPAPKIELKEGDRFYLTLSNVGMVNRPDLFDPHTVHWHGFPNASSIFDGVPDASVSINMGASLTYFYNVVEPGTFMYHCHVEATEHMQMGMLGNLYVTPAQDNLPNGTDLNGFTHVDGNTYAYNDGDGSTRYDEIQYLQIASFDPDFHDASENTQPLPFALMDDKYPMLNGRGYPDTVDTTPAPPDNACTPGTPMCNVNGYWAQREHALITATAGERILLRISSLSTTSYHTLTALGIPMQVVGQGSRKLGPPGDTSQYYTTTSVTLGGGDAYDVILDTTDLSGTYFLYTTNLDHLNNNLNEDGETMGGMMTEIHITAAPVP